MRLLARLAAVAPGVVGAALAVAGVEVLWGIGWALLAGGLFCLLVDWRMR